MKYLLGLILLISVSASAQYSPTAAKTRFVNGIGLGTKDTATMNAADTAAMIVGRDSLVYFRYKGYWKPLAYNSSLSGYVPYTGATSAIDLNSKTVVNISHLGINTTSVPTILLRAIGDNNSTSRISLRGYSSDANSSSMRVTKFRGTVVAPQAPQSGDNLGKFELAGYGTTSSDGYPQASFEGIATENWGATARGAKIQFKVTPNTTTTQALALTINQDKSAVFENSITGTSLIKTGGTSSQFLKANGSVDANAYLNISDTSTMLSGYKTYYPRAALSAGTGITYNSTTGVITNSSPSTGGTVTSVATNNGSGITGGTITTSGTIAADTSVLSTKANVTASLLSKVSSVSGTSPIASSGGLTPAISISQSSGSTNGYLSSTDWTTFNNKGSGSVTSVATDATMTGGTITTSGTLKVDTSIMATRLRVQKGIDSLGAAKQGNITLTTTGTSGVATFSANTLNVPNYTITNAVTGTGTTNYLPKFTGTSTIGNSAITDDGTTVSLLSRALSGTSATFSSSVEVGAGTYSSGLAKLYTSSVYGTILTGKSGSSSDMLLTDRSGNIAFQIVNNGSTPNSIFGGNVGIGTTSPVYKFVVSNEGAEGMEFNTGTLISGNNYIINYNRSTSAYTNFQLDAAKTIFGTQGNVLINTATDAGYKLDVNGTGIFRGALTISGPSFLRFKYSDNFDYYGIGYISGANYGFYNYNYGRTDLIFTQNTGAATFSSSVTASGIIKTGGTGSEGIIAGARTTMINNNYAGHFDGIVSFAAASGLGGVALGFSTTRTNAQQVIYLNATNSTNPDFTIQNAAGTIVTTISNTGGATFSSSVGIGATPVTKLDVRGTSESADATIQIVGNSVSTLLLGQNSRGGVIRGQGGNNELSFWTGGSSDGAASGSGTERMRLTLGGNLLIGSTTDNGSGAKLQVTSDVTISSNLSAGGNLLLGASASTIGALNFVQTGSSPTASRITFGTDGTGYKFAIAKNVSSTITDLFTLQDNGAATFSSSVTTGIPSGWSSAGAWKLGTKFTTTVALDTTGYITVDINGTLYYLALASPL